MTIYGFHKLTSTLKSMENVGSDDRYFEGLLTVQMKDKQGEVTIVDELYKVLPVWIDRGAPISDTHSNRIVGKGINYSRTTVKNDEGHELPAIKITGKIFKNYELDNVIWNKIKNNEYKGLSFGGATRSARSPIKMKDGSTAYALSDLEHYEVAVCADPAVPMAIITDFNQIAKANFNSSVRDDGKMVIQCDKMGCYVNKTGGGDLLTVMEGDKPENYNEVEAGRQRGRPIDVPKKKAEPTGLSEEDLKKWRAIQEDDKEDSDNQYYNKTEPTKLNSRNQKPLDPNSDDDRSFGEILDQQGRKKFMEKKEMMDAVEDLPEKKDIEKAIEILEKAGYRVDTEDRNNGTEINDLQREKRQFNGTKGTLSEKLPMDIQQANLNESQTFEQKVQALIREGKSRESAEKIVGSFVHKVEASSGSGGAGIGGANMTNGGTITTSTGGANNPVHNCDCDCKDCKRNDKCNCCEKCKSKGLDISNTGGGGTTEQAFNQNPPNAQRLNNKSDRSDKWDRREKELGSKGARLNDDDKPKDDDDKPKGKYDYHEGYGDNNLFGKADDELNEKFGDPTKPLILDSHKDTRIRNQIADIQNSHNKADDEEDEEVQSPEEEERPEWQWLMNRHKSKATREVNKVHALLKLNKIRGQCKNCGLKARGMRNEGDKLPVYRSRKTRKQDKETIDGNSNMKFEEGYEDGSNYENKSSGIGKKPRSRNTSRDGVKKPHDKHDSDRDNTNDPPTPKIRYSRGGDTAARQLKMSLNELIKKLPKKLSDYDREDTWEAPDEIDDEDRIHTDVHGLRIGENQERHGGAQRNSIVQGTGESGENAVTSGLGERLANTGNHGDGAGLMTTLSRRNANIMRSNKSLNELKKLHISGGVGSRGLGSAGGYTQGQGETTQITIVQPRPTDDRVEAKRIPKKVTKIRANRGVGAFGSDLPDGSKNEAPVADENTRYIDHNGKAWKTEAERDAVPPRKRRNLRAERARRDAYRADTRQTIGQRTGNSKP